MLWTAAHYAHSKLSAVKRAAFLMQFDYNRLSPEAPKELMVLLGRSTVIGMAGLNLVSEDLSTILLNLFVALKHKHEYAYAWRDKESDEEVKELQERMLTHGWMENLLETALRNTDWQQMSDGAKKQPVEYDVEDDANEWKMGANGTLFIRDSRQTC